MDSIKSFNIESLLDGSLVEQLSRALNTIRRAQEDICAMSGNDDNNASAIRTGTVLTMAILGKMSKGKNPVMFTIEDWEDILSNVEENSIHCGDSEYSVYVFELYEAYIRGSVGWIQSVLSDEKADAVNMLADEIKSKTELFRKEEIDEVEYIESCMWISLEALIKLISGTIDATIGFGKEKVIEAAMTFAFEYGRLTLLKREEALLDSYIQHQKELDVELAIKYEKFAEELKAQTERIEALIDNAFNNDMRYNLRNSVELALAFGVDEEELLTSEDKTDEYFN